jgi:hypothetical protein
LRRRAGAAWRWTPPLPPPPHPAQELERTLHQLVNIVHPRHFTAMTVKRMLCLMYGNCASYRLAAMKEKDLRRKAELCREYIAVFRSAGEAHFGAKPPLVLTSTSY